MGLPKETFEQYCEWVYGKGKKEKVQQNFKGTTSKANDTACKKNVEVLEACRDSDSQKETPNAPASFVPGGGCTKKPPQVYTGDKILGISTMHKSNMVPVFSSDEAVEIARMRR